jgi:hypothetical protein
MQNRDAGNAVRCLERRSNIPYDVFVWFEDPPPDSVAESAMLLVHWGVFDTSGELVGISSGFWTPTGWFRYCCSGSAVTGPVWGRWFDLECNGDGTWSYEPDDFR